MVALSNRNNVNSVSNFKFPRRHLENKTAGAEIEDIRLGGLARRAKHCRELILEHIKNGKEIAELYFNVFYLPYYIPNIFSTI